MAENIQPASPHTKCCPEKDLVLGHTVMKFQDGFIASTYYCGHCGELVQILTLGREQSMIQPAGPSLIKN